MTDSFCQIKISSSKNKFMTMALSEMWADQDYLVKMTSKTQTRPMKSFLILPRIFPWSHPGHNLLQRQYYQPQNWAVLKLPNTDQNQHEKLKTMDLFEIWVVKMTSKKQTRSIKSFLILSGTFLRSHLSHH